MELLKDVIIIFLLAVGAIVVTFRLKLPAIVGLFIAGAIAGPYGLRLISSTENVDTLAHIGVVLLLFTIGIEFSVQHLLRFKRAILLSGPAQVFLLTAFVFLAAWLFGLPHIQSLFLGFMLAMSSTAITMKELQEKAELESSHGQIALSILIFQDILIIPLIIFIPFLAEGIISADDLLMMLAKGGGVLLIAVVAWFVVPRLLFHIAAIRSRELFLISVVVICFSIAWLTGSLGLSPALGAFLAGLIISNTDYSEQSLSIILPFKDVFLTLFFISVGMLLNLPFVAETLLLIVVIAVALFSVKFFLTWMAVMVTGYPVRIGIRTGLVLAQVGEFSFILLTLALRHNLIDNYYYQLFLASSILTMAVTPIMIAHSSKLCELITSNVLFKRVFSKFWDAETSAQNSGLAKQKLSEHIVVVGYGVTGRDVVKSAVQAGIPYTVIEMNPATVRTEKDKVNIFYGDASQEYVLQFACIDSAKVVVVTVYDPVSLRRTAELVKKRNSNAYLIARTRFLSEIEPLKNLGVDKVIAEELETSLAIVSHVLTNYQ